MRDILSERLRQLRDEFHYTQREVAIYSDITEQTYQNYERMTREPKLETAVRIAHRDPVSPDYLVGRTNRRTASE